MHAIALRRSALAGLLVLAVAACGGGAATADETVEITSAPEATSAIVDTADVGAIVYEEADPEPGTTLNACQIIDAEDVQAAFGLEEAVADGTFEADPTVLSPNHSECRYEGDFGRLIISLTPEDGANLYDAAHGAYDDLQELGLGDGSFYSDDTNRAFVWQERVAAMLSIHPVGSSLDSVAIAESLAEAMLAKL
jgi:hypothetical protein